jgi:hypothetical protein
MPQIQLRHEKSEALPYPFVAVQVDELFRQGRPDLPHRPFVLGEGTLNIP